MADKKISQLTALTSPATGDLLVVVDDPKGKKDKDGKVNQIEKKVDKSQI